MISEDFIAQELEDLNQWLIIDDWWSISENFILVPYDEGCLLFAFTAKCAQYDQAMQWDVGLIDHWNT